MMSSERELRIAQLEVEMEAIEHRIKDCLSLKEYDELKRQLDSVQREYVQAIWKGKQ
jgi:hypothetical protein